MTLSTGGFRQVVAFPPAPIATGWSDPMPEGTCTLSRTVPFHGTRLRLRRQPALRARSGLRVRWMPYKKPCFVGRVEGEAVTHRFETPEPSDIDGMWHAASSPHFTAKRPKIQ